MVANGVWADKRHGKAFRYGKDTPSRLRAVLSQILKTTNLDIQISVTTLPLEFGHSWTMLQTSDRIRS